MGEQLVTTAYRGRVLVNPAAMARTVAMLLQTEAGGVFVIARADGVLVGMIGLLLFENPITGEATASELFWWVDPECRGQGVRLLKRAEAWAKASGAEQLHMVAPTAAVGELYDRLGYEFLEATYRKALT